MSADDLDVPPRSIKPAPKRSCNCCFCGAAPSQVELVFRSDIGGEPPFICSDCVERYCRILELHRRAPELAGALIRAVNGRAAK